MRNFCLIALALFVAACSGEKKFQKSPVDELIRDLNAEPTFSIILYDMDIEEGTFSDKYKHQYQIIKEKDSTPVEAKTQMIEVSKEFFMQNQNNMGMEIAAKTRDGKVSKVAGPPGYSNYVGNSRYGNWSTGSDGNSFWAFYGQYAMMSSLLNMATGPIYRNHYDDYNSNYRGSRPYYGSTVNGLPQYGTNSSHIQQSKPNFFSRMSEKKGWSSSNRSTPSTRSSGSSPRSSGRSRRR
jgi:hypothetical protein